MRYGFALLSLSLLCAGCSDSDGPVDNDDDGGSGGAGAAGGAGGAPGTGGGGGTTGGLPDSCDAACQMLSAVIDFGNGQRPIERAFYGLTTTTEATKLYVELSRGGGDSCPSMTAPTPERLVLIHDIPIPESTQVQTDADGITSQYFDFIGDDLPTAVQTPAVTISLTPRALNLSDPGGLFALDVNIAFDGGSASGGVYATHCDSLDTTQ